MAGIAHLAKRFFGAIRPGAPRTADEQWAIAALSQGEAEIWSRMNNPDRRHAIQVARDVEQELTTSAAHDDSPLQTELASWAVPAALLHDSGKVVSGFRTPARVVATVLWSVAGDEVAEKWLTSKRRPLRRMAEYRLHPQIGAELLQAAGAHEHTVAWAAQHHTPRTGWTVPVEIGDVLKRCDDD